ncbi:MAG: NUDIX domain-containing protein [Candidatus Pacebacteria bacterium]|nr:NUDIX domain-containing protein [Candidatus Paceibacterota bacterium]
MILLAELNFENTPEDEASTFGVRNTARAVVFDNDKNIALMNVSKEHFHKLPGGGIDNDEKPKEALKRECKEEAGVEIDAIVELGFIKEIKKESKAVQNSYCYIAHVIGKKGLPQFTEFETAKGFKILWVSIDDALDLVKNDTYEKIAGKYIAERELAILKAAKEIYYPSHI